MMASGGGTGAIRIRRCGSLALCLLAGWAVLGAGETPSPAPTAWSLSGQGNGVSKLVPVMRGGRKLQVLIASGGNTLAVQRPATTAAAEGTQSVPGDRLKLQCDLLLAEYDDQDRQIERLLCAGHVQVTILSLRTDDRGQAGQTSYFAAEALAFQRAAPAPDRATGAARVGPLGLLNGTWTLSSTRPAWPDVPAEFTQWLEKMPAAGGERVLLRSDRLTVLAPEVVFDPVGGRCTAGPTNVTGSFAPDPHPGADRSAAGADGAGRERSTAWTDLRRTVFSCQKMSGQFRLDEKGLEPTGPTVMEGRVLVYQPPAGKWKDQAELRGETVTVQWPATPDRRATDVQNWQGYESLTVQGGGDRPELELRDGDLLIRGGTLTYQPAEDFGKLIPAAGQKYVLSEMNLAADAAQPEPRPEQGAPGRVRLQANALSFHLKTRNFEAQGERILENLPALPATPPAR